MHLPLRMEAACLPPAHAAEPSNIAPDCLPRRGAHFDGLIQLFLRLLE